MADNLTIPEGFEIISTPEQQSSKFGGTIAPMPEYHVFDKMAQALQNVAQIPVKAWGQGSKNVRSGELNFKEMSGNISKLEKSELAMLENRTQYNYGAREHSRILDNSDYITPRLENLPERAKNSLIHYTGAGVESIPFSLEIAKSGGVGGVALGAIGGIAGGVVGLVKGGPQGAIKNAKSGMIIGARIGGGSGAAKKSFELEAGLAYEELKNMVDDEGKPIDPELAKRLAYGVGAVNASLEMIGAAAELSTIPGAEQLLKSTKIEVTKKILKDKILQNKILNAGSKALAKHFADEVPQDALKAAADANIRKFVRGVTTESGTEMLQEVSNIVASEWAKQIEGNYSDALFSEDGINSNTFKQHLARTIEAGISATMPAMTFAGVGTTATALNIARKKGLSEQEAENFVNALSYDNKVEFINNNEETLLEIAEDSMIDEKLAQIQDDSFNKMVNAGISEEQAFANAKLVGAMAKSFNNIEQAQKWADSINFVSDANTPILQGGVEMNVNADNALNAHFQSAAMRKSHFNNFTDFYNDAIAKPKNTSDKEQFNFLSKDNINLRIPHDTILHEQKKHKLSTDEWKDLLDNIDNVSNAVLSKQKSRFNGKPVLLKINTNNNTYGVVLETFPKNNPLIVTAFIDTEKNIDNWIKNEAIPSGTKTSFLSIRLNDIITNIQPDFKSKTINNVYFQSAYHGTPHRFDKFSLDNIGTGEGAQAHGWGLYFAENKDVSEGYREDLARRNNNVTITLNGKEIKYSKDKGYIYKNNDKIAIPFGDDCVIADTIITKQKTGMSISEILKEAKERQKNNGLAKNIVKFLKKNKLDVDIPKGQLFEVDIPESDVLLDEDKSIEEQPEKVQKALSKLLEENFAKSELFKYTAIPVSVYLNNNEIGEGEFVEFALSIEIAKKYGKETAIENLQKEKELNDDETIPYDKYIDFIKKVDLNNIRLEERTYLEQTTGKEIYETISKELGSPKEASLLLNEYNIKGITYDGKTDGRCYVIFDDKTVDVLKTYYQSQDSDLYYNEFAKNSDENTNKYSQDADTLDTTKEQPDIYFQKNNNIAISPVKIETNSIPNFEKISELKSWIEENLNLIGEVNIKSNNRTVQFSKSGIARSLKRSGQHDVKRNSYAGLKELVENAVYGYTKTVDEKHSKRNNGQEIYHNAFSYNGDIYGIEISIDIPKTSNSPYNYAGHKIKVIKIASAANEVSENSGLLYSPEANISITDIQELFKSKLVQNYNNDFKHLQSENRINSNVYFQDKEENLSYSDSGLSQVSLSDIHKAVRERSNGYEYLGYFTKAGEKNIVGVMENANASTIVHELAHCFLEALKDFAQSDRIAAEKLEAVKNWLGVTDNNFTREHHEKFAHGFEAYLYNGKAPNRTLQEVFNQFKEWLKGIKDYWLNNKDGFVMNEDIKQVFDKLFEEKPQETAKQKRIKKYLETARNIQLDDDMLTDSQHRHKEAAYDIVSIATGKNKKYLKMILESSSEAAKISKQKEEIARLCNECDDKITVNGFMPEWAEFYSNAEYYQGNDYLLAEAALSDIQNKSYRNYFTSADYFNEYQAQYEYLINTYREEILSRDEVFAAVWDWLDEIGKNDNEAGGLFAEKFIQDMQYIERFEKMSKIEQAKHNILKAVNDLKYGDFQEREAAGRNIKEAIKSIEYETPSNDGATVENIIDEITLREQNLPDDVRRFRDTVKSILNKLKFLTPADKARMFSNILDAPNANFLEATIDNIMDIAKTMNEVQYRRTLLNKIYEEVRATKNVKQANKLVGKYDYRTNKLFEQLRAYSKLTTEEANNIRLEREQLLEEAENEGMTFEDRILNSFIRIKADGMQYANTALIKQVYDDIVKIKLAGKVAKDELDFSRKLNNKNKAEELAKILETKKEGSTIEKLYINTTANWESMLNTFFNKKIKDKYSLIYNETKASVWTHKEKQAFEKEVQKIYGLAKWNFDAEILKNLSQQHTFMKNNREKIIDSEGKTQYPIRRVVPFKMNKMELILAYMWDKNEVLHERLVNMFGEDQLIEMIDLLSEQDKKLGDLMMHTVNKYYPLANEVYIKKYGIDLPKVSAYFPAAAEREGSLSEIDLFRDFTQKSSSPSFSKLRSQSTYIPLKFSNPVAMLYHHIDTMGRFIHMTEPIDTINKAFNTTDIKDLIKDKYGDTAQKEFLQQLVNISYKQNATIRTEQMRIVNEMVGNWTSGNIIGKPSTGIKQLFAAWNYSTVMPAGEWHKGFLKALSHPKETIKYMYDKIDYLQYRFESGAQNEALKQFIDNNQIEKWLFNKLDSFTKNENIKKMLKMSTITAPRKVKDVASLFLRVGDMGAIIFGGKPYIDYLIKQGMPESEAIKQFVLETQRTQQSAEISTLSNWQVASGSNPFSKLFMNYKNAQGQFIRKMVDSAINYKRGEITKTQLAKDIFMYGFFQQFLFKAATSLSLLTLINTGDSKDLIDDLLTSIFDNFSFYHVFGDIGVAVINKILTGDSYVSTSPLFGDISKEIFKVVKEGAQIEDWIHAMGFLIQVKEGIPINAGINEIEGIGDILQGNLQKGAIRTLGWSKHTAETATGTKTKKKKSTKSKKHSSSLY